MAKDAVQVELRAWSEDDLVLLRLQNTPEMTEHLGGPESEEKLLNRHQRYLNISGQKTGNMFSVVQLPHREKVGSVGYWDSDWQGEEVYETGWSILPLYQNKGLATAAMLQVIGIVKRERKYRSIHAFPAIDNPGSNGVCRKLGFTLDGPCEVEYPKGSMMQSNHWFLEL
ncbi:GNAT family N-acetyltransferase [Gorillibacterium massiliense]|uniref:GNAT family N-acetyltransferase n=1 Tax=Gorillibacterium massiliense TaxID=1280390 RepID=UPI0004B2E35C|nr:GNAT family N-acetyltransferase [Gorillibacterium massiliense]